MTATSVKAKIQSFRNIQSYLFLHKEEKQIKYMKRTSYKQCIVTIQYKCNKDCNKWKGKDTKFQKHTTSTNCLVCRRPFPFNSVAVFFNRAHHIQKTDKYDALDRPGVSVNKDTTGFILQAHVVMCNKPIRLNSKFRLGKLTCNDAKNDIQITLLYPPKDQICKKWEQDELQRN